MALYRKARPDELAEAFGRAIRLEPLSEADVAVMVESVRSASPKRGVCFQCGEPAYSRRAMRCDKCATGCKPASIETAVLRAVKQGKLRPAKEFACVDCGKPAKHYDHRDYNKPLDVEPVCARCNQRRGPAIPFRKAAPCASSAK